MAHQWDMLDQHYFRTCRHCGARRVSVVKVTGSHRTRGYTYLIRKADGTFSLLPKCPKCYHGIPT